MENLILSKAHAHRKKKYSIKQILTSNQNWWNFYEKFESKIRTGILICIIKLLSCKNKLRGYREYHCSNPTCSHVKHIPFSCKCKACSSCGRKATEIWMEKQNAILPVTSWQHITFTMPSELWDFFWLNRYLLNDIPKQAATAIQNIAQKKSLTPGIFVALHTFGRDLKRNVHVHLSTTAGGITSDGLQWKSLFFHQATLMRQWRYHVMTLFRKAHRHGTLIIPNKIQQQLTSAFTLDNFFTELYQKTWIVDCAKPTNDHKKIIGYLSRYLKRPPIAESKLKHYDGNNVTFKYLDHTTKTYKKFSLTAEQFIAKFIQHIPDVGFRMIRYYGFLAHRVRGQLLPRVNQILGHEIEEKKAPTYAQMMQKYFGVNPLICVLCQFPLVLVATYFNKNNIFNLTQHHRELALLKNCP